MNRPAGRVLAVLLCAVIAAPALVQSAAAQHELIAEDPANERWHRPEGSDQAVFLGSDDQRTPLIVLNLEPMVHAPARLSVESDGRIIEFSAGEITFRLPIRRKRKNSLILSADPDRGMIMLRDKKVAAAMGYWLRICRNGEHSTVTLHLLKATYATITFEADTDDAPKRGASHPGAIRSRAAVADPTGASRADTLPAPQMLARVKQSVFQLRAKSLDKKVFLSGTGFLIGADGAAVTNFHVIRGAVGADAHLVGRSEPIPVELIAVRPDLDLALIRLRWPDPETSVAPLLVARDQPEEGEDVWAIGFPKQLGYTVTRGVVNGVRQYHKLPKKLTRSLGYNSGSVWIQTDCTINSGNSGGPLVDRHGQVVGVNAWVWRAGSNLFFALSAAHIDELRQSAGPQPLTFARAGREFAGVRAAHGSFPQLEVEPAKKPAALIAAAKGFRRAAHCRVCKGRGVYVRRIQLPPSRPGAIESPRYADRQRTCPRCRGTRIGDPDKLHLLGEKLIETLSKSDPGHHRHNESIIVAKDLLREAMDENSPGLERILNREAMKTISHETEQIGAPMVLVGRLARDIRMPGEGKRFRIVTMNNDRKTLVIFEPRMVQTSGSSTVLVGGLLAGFLDNDKGAVVPVLQHGLVIGASDKPSRGDRGGQGTSR